MSFNEIKSYINELHKIHKKIAEAGLKNCNISIKGANEKEYIENTKSLGFNEMVQGYNNLKKTKVNVSTSYVLCDNNHEHFNYFGKHFVRIN